MKEISISVKLTVIAIITLTLTGAAVQPPSPQPVQSYGDANVVTIHRLDEHVRLYCDIADFPPVVGQNIPVCVKGLKAAANPQDNLKLLMFLNDLFLSKDGKPEKIILKNIQRGEQFCLVADIEVDGKDLCDLLIEKKLAQKVIEVPHPPTTSSSTLPQGQNGTGNTPATDTQYIAAKSSKVYHRSTCPHAARIDAAKAVTFTTRDEAEKTGRRPCKTCKP
jgi:hypothetical protein